MNKSCSAGHSLLRDEYTSVTLRCSQVFRYKLKTLAEQSKSFWTGLDRTQSPEDKSMTMDIHEEQIRKVSNTYFETCKKRPIIASEERSQNIDNQWIRTEAWGFFPFITATYFSV